MQTILEKFTLCDSLKCNRKKLQYFFLFSVLYLSSTGDYKSTFLRFDFSVVLKLEVGFHKAY